MADDSVQRHLAAILSADVVGYSRLMGMDEAGTLAALQAHRCELIDPEIEKHGGRLVKLMGDGALVEFASIVQATECAVAIQRGMSQRNAEIPADQRIDFRIGLNLGDVIVDGDDIYGDGINVAARLEALAEPGGICVSQSVRTAVGTKLPLAYAFLGEREVKNIAEPVRAYRLILGDEAARDGMAHMTPRCPYPGMVPFSAADAPYFYGRTEEIARMVQLLRRQRFMMVIGPSGSGKSSLVYAGLLPELERSRYFAEGYWLIRAMRPGPQPTRVLAGVMGGDAAGGGFEPGTVDALLQAHAPAERLLLLVDQFEEVFAQGDREERGRFIAALQALRAPTNCALILTLRADFYPDLMNSYLWPVDASQRVEVAPLRGGALREAIQRPAANVGVHIEDSLVNQLLNDASDEPGVLPLMQETMGLLWDEIEHHTLKYNAYQRLSDTAGQQGNNLSGLTVAIAMKADSTLAELTPDQQAIARRIFLRLIQFGEGRADTRRQQSIAALGAASDAPGEFERTLEHLTANRLVTRSGGDRHTPPAVDISHESLIVGWSRLQDWVNERREAEQIRRRLEGKAAEWVRLGKDTGGLLDEAELPEAERWLGSPDAADLGVDATLPELVAASQRAIAEAEEARKASQQRELAQARALAAEQARAARRMRRSAVSLAVVFVVAVGAAVFAWKESREAEARRIEAQQAEEEATRLAEAEVQARTQAETRRVEAENARLASIAQLLSIHAPQQQAALQDEKGALLARQAYRFSTTGSRPLKMQVDKTLREVVGKPDFSSILWPRVQAVAFSPDGTKLASADIGRIKVLLWDLTQPGEQPTILPGYPGTVAPNSTLPLARIYSLAFSPDGKALVAANADGSIGRWALDRPQAPFEELPRQEGGVWSAAFSPDGRWLALGSKFHDSFAVWDLAEPAPVLVTDPQPAVAGSGPSIEMLGGVPVAFSSDSTTLATGSLNGIIRLWRPDDLTQPVASLRGHEGGLSALDFYDNGRRLASSGQDATIRLWNLENPSAAPVILEVGDSPASWIDVDAHGQALAVSYPNHGIRLWRISEPEVPAVPISGGFIVRVAFSPDGKRLASAGTDEGLRLRDLEPSGRPQVLTGHQSGVTSFAFSPDMTRLASGGGTGDGTIRLWRWDDLDASPVVLDAGEGTTINNLSMSADGERLLSASWNGNSVRLWDLSRSSPSSTPLSLPEGSEPWMARFGPEEQTVAATSLPGVYFWRMADLTADPKLVVPTEDWATELAFSPSGQYLAVASTAPVVYFKDLTRPDTAALELPGHEGGVWSVAFSADGTKLATGGRDGVVRLWDPTAPHVPSIVLGRHDDPVRQVRFSPGRNQLATAGDHTARLWDVENLDVVPTVLSGHEGEVVALEYSPDGKFLVTGSRDQTIRIWDLTHPLNASTTEELAELVCEKVWRNLTLDEWQKFVGAEIPYERTCPNLPIHPSLFESAEKLAKAGDVAGAVALLERARELDPDLGLDPEGEAERLAGSRDE